MDYSHLLRIGLRVIDSGKSSDSSPPSKSSDVSPPPAKLDQETSASKKSLKKIELACTEVLRHHCMDGKLLPDDMALVGPDGFCSVESLLALPSLKALQCDLKMLQEVMKSSKKGRLEMKQEGNAWFIRACQGHTIDHIDEALLGLVPISLENLPLACIHCTYLKSWSVISEQGLSKMARNHVHFATSLDAKSGKRSSCDIAIFMDIELALKQGLELFMSANGVILSPGFDGIVPSSLFQRVVHLKDGQVDEEAPPLWPPSKSSPSKSSDFIPPPAKLDQGLPEVLPSSADMNLSGNVGEAVERGAMFREIRAIHDEETVRVYQAYNWNIAKAACEANSFRGPLENGKWSATRMTWIKPSAVWMAYRCGWTVMKDKNQGSVLALDLSKPRFLELLKTAVLSHGEEAKGGDTTADKPVIVQWDPERLMSTVSVKTNKGKEKDCFTSSIQTMRSIQIGLRGKGVEMLLDPSFVLKITDVTDDFQRAHAALSASPPDIAAAVKALWPHRQETTMVVPSELRDILHMDDPFDPTKCPKR